MLDFIGTIVLVAAIIVSINALTGAMPISPSQRIALSVGAGLWTGLAAALAGANLFLGTKSVGPADDRYDHRVSAGRDFRCGVDLAVGARCAARDADALPDRPERLACGGRIFPSARGRRPACRAISNSAGWGDIITGVLALPVAWLALRGQGKALVWGWNAFGMLDLVAALAFGIISANGSPLQIIHAGEGSAGGADAAMVADSDRAGADVS